MGGSEIYPGEKMRCRDETENIFIGEKEGLSLCQRESQQQQPPPRNYGCRPFSAGKYECSYVSILIAYPRHGRSLRKNDAIFINTDIKVDSYPFSTFEENKFTNIIVFGPRQLRLID